MSDALPEAPPGLPGLRELALQGRWREVATRCQTTSTSVTEVALAVSSYQALAYIKLKMYAEADALVNKLGNLDDSLYTRKTAQGPVSLAPFALRWLAACLPSLLGRPAASIDRLHALLRLCLGRAERAGGGAAGAERWRRRANMASFHLAALYSRQRQWQPALQVLDAVLARDPESSTAWAQAGAVQLLMGDARAAARSFDSAAAAPGARPQDVRSAARGKSLVMIARQDFVGAARELGRLAAEDPADGACAAALAVARMYQGDLASAVAGMEAAFVREPEAMLQEGLVLNLASMYDLSAAAAGGPGPKRAMAGWVAASAPDDFDLASCKA